MLTMSASTIGNFVGRNYKKLLAWGAAVAMLVVSAVAVFNAINILAAPADGWRIEVDGTGLLNVLTAVHDETGERKVAYCLDPYTDFTTKYPDYVDIDSADTAEVQALLKRTYPVLTPRQMGIVYLNDQSLTELEAYEATQIAIWKIVTGGEYEVNDVLTGRQFELAQQLLTSDVEINEGSWLSVDTSAAVRASSTGVRDAYGPIKINVDTGSDWLDAVIKTENLTLTKGDSDANWVFSTSTSANGSAATQIRAGTGASYYVNYAKTDAGTIGFSLAGVVANSAYLNDMAEIQSVYGPEVNQVLGVVDNGEMMTSAGVELMPEGSLTFNLNKTWNCNGKTSDPCEAFYDEPVYFDIYINNGGTYQKVTTLTTEFTGTTQVSIPNTVTLAPYTEYVVIERTLVSPTPGANEILTSASMSGSNSGTSGRYKTSGDTIVAATSSEAYYTGMKFTTGMGGLSETVNFTNRITNMQISLGKTVSWDWNADEEVVPDDDTNYYIYQSSDNGSTWTSLAGPIKMYDYDTRTASADYTFNMTPGYKYRVIEDTMMTSYQTNGNDEYCTYYFESSLSAYLTGSNTGNLSSPRGMGFTSYTNAASNSGSGSTLYTYIYDGYYPGIEWTAGWSDSTMKFNINNRIQYSSWDDCNYPPEPPYEIDWSLGASIRKTTTGDAPNGWDSEYDFIWERTFDGYTDDGVLTVGRNSSEQLFYESGTTMSDEWNIPSVSYTVYEDPNSFCQRKVSGPTLSTSTDQYGTTTNTTSSVYSYVNMTISGSYSSSSKQYAAVDCSTGSITGSWSSTTPASGEYVTRITANVYSGYTSYSDITFNVTNGYRTESSSNISTPAGEGRALIMKYAHDGVNTVSQYLDGTEFNIYNADDDSLVSEWILSAENRGRFGSIGGTSYYYMTPLLPEGEYYVMETKAVDGYIADKLTKYYFTVTPLVNASNYSLTTVRKNNVPPTGSSLLDRAIVNTPSYDLSVFKFKRKVLESAIEDSYIELYKETDTTEEPAYGNENLRGYEKVAEFSSLENGIVIEELAYGWYKLVEVTPPDGFVGPEPEIAVGFSTYIGPTSSPSNNYSGARVYIANDWVGFEVPDPDPDPDPDPTDPEVPQVPNTGSGRVGINGGMVAASFLGIGCMMVLGIAMFVGRKLTDEIDENGSIKLRR